jgi:tetratricopeptide (TPR) repeat protein
VWPHSCSSSFWRWCARQIVDALAVKVTETDEQRSSTKDTANFEAHEAFLKGWEHFRRCSPGDFAAARDYFEKAVALDPNDPENQISVARALIFLGREEEAVRLIERAKRLKVHYPAEYAYLHGLAHFGMEQFGQAAADLGDALDRSPEYFQAEAPLSAAYSYLGRKEEAFRNYAKDEAETPRAHYGQLERDLRLHWPYRRQSDWDRLAEGLAESSDGLFRRISPLPTGAAETSRAVPAPE